MLRWLAIITLLFQALPFTSTRPQSAIEVNFVNTEPLIDFGTKISFKVNVSANQPVQKIFLYLEPEGKPASFFAMTLAADGTASYDLSVADHPLRVFSNVSYHYRVTIGDQTDIESRVFSFAYNDNRFDWKMLEDESFQVSWYGRDVDFGQQALNAAQAGMESAAKVFPRKLDSPVRIYIYASALDLQSTRNGTLAWVAGHASPDMRLILVSIPDGPSQNLELQRQVPHELAHILQYAAYGERSKNIPTWLLEGSASIVELYPNPDYANVLQTSVQQDLLIPIEQLCGEFPRDASSAFLAYAQSQSFARFLLQKYGSSGMQSLFEQYANGLGCKEGVQTALGSSLTEVEYKWRMEALGVNPAALIVQNLLPYLVFLFLVLGAGSVIILTNSKRRHGAGTP